jgi:flagellar biosynthesis/type III secretory pathway protein FliH
MTTQIEQARAEGYRAGVTEARAEGYAAGVASIQARHDRAMRAIRAGVRRLNTLREDRRLALEARDAERERCARIAESMVYDGGLRIAERIRKGSER